MLGRVSISAAFAGVVLTHGPPALAQTTEAPASPTSVATPPSQPPPPAPDYTWQHRFALERPTVIRDIEGTRIPPGYEQSTRYDGRRVIVGSLTLGLGYALTIAASSILAPGDAKGFVPCVGPFIVDRPQRTDGDFVHADVLSANFLGVLGCSLEILGAIELTRALIDERPVLVRSGSDSASLRFSLTARAERHKASLSARFQF